MGARMEREIDPGVFNHDCWENGDKKKNEEKKIEDLEKKSVPCTEDFSGFVFFKLSFCGLQVGVYMRVYIRV